MSAPKLNPSIQYWITSDTHYGHRYVAVKQRGFETIEEHDNYLIDVHNSMVKPEDIVIHLGDVTFHNKANAQALFTKLQGHYIFVPGNHDSSRILNRLVEVKQDLGFNFSAIWPRLHEIKVGDTYVALCHYPLTSWNHSDSPVVKSVNLHGHLHGTAGHHDAAPYTGNGYRRDIGVDTNTFYTPYKIEDALAFEPKGNDND